MCWDIYVVLQIADMVKEISKTPRKISLNADLTFWDIYVLFANLDDENHLEDVSVCKR